MPGRLRTALASVFAVAAVLVVAAPAGAGSPQAGASTDHLLAYVTGGKLKVKKRISYEVTCASSCSLTAETKLKLKGPDLGPIVATGTAVPGQTAVAVIELNKGARNAIKAKIRAAKLVTEVTATDLTTGEVDVDSRSYRFKR